MMRHMDYLKQLKLWRERRAKILAFVSSGKSRGQAAAKFGISRQRVQQITREGAKRNGA